MQPAAIAIAASAAERRLRFSPAESTWYWPFCRAFTGSTRAALRAGRNAAIMLVTTPTAAAVTSSQGRTSSGPRSPKRPSRLP